MEFIHYHAGTRDDPSGIPPKAVAQIQGTSEHRLAPAMAMHDPRAPNRWNASVKVRHYESVHLPEYSGWHNAKKAPSDNAAWSWKPSAGNGLPVQKRVYVSRGPNLRVSENAGFSWDPTASYGPETVQALPAADNRRREMLFDESTDQKFDGVPDTGIHTFGSAQDAGNQPRFGAYDNSI